VDLQKEKAIRAIVKSSVEAYSAGFSGRHLGELNDPEGTLNMKIHNIFIALLGKEYQYYTALVRSFDSSLGNMLETMAMNIATLSYLVEKEVAGTITSGQVSKIAEILEAYKRRVKKPEVKDYLELTTTNVGDKRNVRHDSDYYLVDENTGSHFLIELKIGGDLDNKKARSEKEALLEQYSILSNSLGPGNDIQLKFATAYNRYGEEQPWSQERVRQFFADDELLIGRDFWNFVCKSNGGYEVVIDEYKNNSGLIKTALDKIKEAYLGR
jgi:hypothetical protein